MFGEVLVRLSSDTGLHYRDKRTLLVKILQKAAKQMYDMLECSKIYREVTLVVPPDAVVSLPNFIRELRGMRIHTNEIPFDLHNIGQPRYTSNTLQHWYKNWRDLGESPVDTVLSDIGQLTITVPQVETIPVTLLINGQTNVANRIEEQILIDGISKQTVNLFGPKLYTIACMATDRTCDISIKDVNGAEIAQLLNWQNETRYKIVDVSRVFWPQDTTDGQSLIDVLYKVPPYMLSQDSDTFYAGSDYDDAWYNMAMYFHLKPLQNRLADAQQFHGDAIAFLKSAKESGEEGQMKKITYGRNRFYGFFNRYRAWPGSITNVDRSSEQP